MFHISCVKSCFGFKFVNDKYNQAACHLVVKVVMSFLKKLFFCFISGEFGLLLASLLRLTPYKGPQNK